MRGTVNESGFWIAPGNRFQVVTANGSAALVTVAERTFIPLAVETIWTALNGSPIADRPAGAIAIWDDGNAKTDGAPQGPSPEDYKPADLQGSSVPRGKS